MNAKALKYAEDAAPQSAPLPAERVNLPPEYGDGVGADLALINVRRRVLTPPKAGKPVNGRAKREMAMGK